MTLKEELSLNRKIAIEERGTPEQQADEEARKVISGFIAPILRLMNEEDLLQKELSIQVIEQDTQLFFTPQTVRVSLCPEMKVCKPVVKSCEVMKAFFRVASEFDLETTKKESDVCCFLTMTLDDWQFQNPPLKCGLYFLGDFD